MTPQYIFIDSDAFIALIKEDDSNHQKAKKIFEQLENLPINFITSNYVFSEVLTVLSQRVSHKIAVTFIQNMVSDDSVFQIERINEEVERRAIQVFINQSSKNISFVDCTNIALIKTKGWESIFSFDEGYIKNGLRLAGDL